MNSQEQEKMLKIATQITDGDIQSVDLTCPYCEKGAMLFSFAKGKPPRYALFVACTICGHRSHFHLSVKPPNFREDLVMPEFQALEDKVTEAVNNNR